MATQVEICNLALREIGAKVITAVGGADTSKESLVCEDVWSLILSEVLSEHPWNFAKIWVALTVDATYTFVDDLYEYAYEIPSDWIRESKTEDKSVKWEIREEFILSNVEDMEMEYIGLITTTTKFPPHFIRALVGRLKPTLAAAIGTKVKPSELLQLYYGVDLPKAKKADANSDRPSEADELRHTTTTDTWLSAR